MLKQFTLLLACLAYCYVKSDTLSGLTTIPKEARIISTTDGLLVRLAEEKENYTYNMQVATKGVFPISITYNDTTGTHVYTKTVVNYDSEGYAMEAQSGYLTGNKHTFSIYCKDMSTSVIKAISTGLGFTTTVVREKDHYKFTTTRTAGIENTQVNIKFNTNTTYTYTLSKGGIPQTTTKIQPAIVNLRDTVNKTVSQEVTITNWLYKGSPVLKVGTQAIPLTQTTQTSYTFTLQAVITPNKHKSYTLELHNLAGELIALIPVNIEVIDV